MIKLGLLNSVLFLLNIIVLGDIMFKEIKATCLGYSNRSTSGNAIGKELRKCILRTVKELAESGYCGENEKEEWITNVMGYIRDLRNNAGKIKS